MPPIVAASSREAPSSTAAIANRSRLRSIFRSLGKTANLAGGIVRPHRNGLAHGKPPQFAILNHAAIDSGIPKESATQRLGINGGISVLQKTTQTPPRATARTTIITAACFQSMSQDARRLCLTGGCPLSGFHS